MDKQLTPTAVFWVVGNGTDVGKTTIATALIRVLNKFGVPAAGFKPRAALRVQDSIDFMLDNYPASKCTIYGGDSVKLVRASPLTSDEMIEVVVPTQFICYPHFLRRILARTGAALLGNLEYFKTAETIALFQRQDFSRLIEKTSLPVEKAKIMQSLPLALSPEKHNASFDYLVKLGAKAIVCEGASDLLPIWRGSPSVAHIFVISGDALHLYAGINMPVNPLQNAHNIPSIRELTPSLKQAKCSKFATNLFMIESKHLNEMSDKVVSGLLEKAGII